MLNKLKLIVVSNRFQVSILTISLLSSPWLSIFNRNIYVFHLVLVLLMRTQVYRFFNPFKRQELKLPKPYKFINIFYLIWFAMTALIVIVNMDKANLKSLIIYLMFFCTIYLITKYLDSIDSIELSLKIFLIIVFIQSIISILEAVTSFRLPFSMYLLRDFSQYNPEKIAYLMSYPTAFYYNPNDLAFVLVGSLGFSLSAIRYSTKKLFPFMVIIGTVIAINFTKSRASIIAIVLTFFIYFLLEVNLKDLLYKIKNKLFYFLPLFIMIILLSKKLILSVYYQLSSIITLILKGDFSNSPYHSIRERWSMIVTSLELIYKHPFGVGVGNGSSLVAKELGYSTISIHNYLLEITLDFGLIFLILWLVYNLKVISKLFKIYKSNSSNRYKLISLGIILYKVGFLISFIGPSSISYFLPYWYLEGIVISFVMINIKNDKIMKERLNESFYSNTLL